MKYLVELFSNTILIVVTVTTGLVLFALHSPLSPLPTAWNPYRPFDPADEVTFATRFKLQPLIEDEALCQQALTALNVTFEKRQDFVSTENDVCGISNRTFVEAFDNVAVGPIETQCHIAVRMALWTRDIASPSAFALFGERLTRVETQGSYNCRPMRTDDGPGEMMSEHSTANAIDVRALTLQSGREISLTKGWNGTANEAQFLRELRDGGCQVFRATLSPDFNRVHEDHFHFDAGRFRVCR